MAPIDRISKRRIKSSAGDAVSKRWRLVEYKNGPNNVKAEPETTTKGVPEVVIIDSESESEQETDIEETKFSFVPDEGYFYEKSFCFKLLRSMYYDINISENRNFISMEKIFNDKELKKTILFSFQFQMNFLLGFFHKNIESIIIVGQKECVLPIDPTDTNYRQLSEVQRKVREIDIYMPQYTSHHTKMVINYYTDNSVRIFLPSNNFTHAEVNLPQQICWCSPKIYYNSQNSTAQNSSFGNGLIKYLESYDDKKIQKYILPDIRHLDFKNLHEVEFVFSCPNREVKAGISLLAEFIESHDTSKEDNKNKNGTFQHFLCQTSSMGGAVGKDQNIFTNFIIPALSFNAPRFYDYTKKRHPKFDVEDKFEKLQIVPHVLFPTLNEIIYSPSSSMCGGWFNFKHDVDSDYYKWLRYRMKIFYKQDSKQISNQRGTTPSHSKFYMKWNSNSKISNKIGQMDWCLYTSANMSSVAWGRLTSNPRNYEAGVLFTNKDSNPLKCLSFVDLIYNKKEEPTANIVILPLSKTFKPYDEQDEPTDVSILDRLKTI